MRSTDNANEFLKNFIILRASLAVSFVLHPFFDGDDSRPLLEQGSAAPHF